MHVLDLFAGSGSVGIEALSQGAAHCTFTDLGADAVVIIKKNLATTGFADRAEVRQTDAFGYLRTTRRPFDLIYVAPPQYKELWLQSIRLIAARLDILRSPPAGAENPTEAHEPAMVIVQVHPKEYVNLELDGIREVRQNAIGNSLLVFYERAGESSPKAGFPTGLATRDS